MKEKVLASGHYLFYNKPMIVKAWERDMEMTKEDVKCVPAWLRLHRFPLKFWGKGLPKIAGIVCKHVKNDTATEERTRLGFARVMVELVVDQELPAKIAFKDEHGLVNQIEIEYELKPIKCKKCQRMGHDQEQCRIDKLVKEKTVTKKVCRPVVKTANPKIATSEMQVVPSKPSTSPSKLPKTPVKRLVLLRRGDSEQEKEKDGYSRESFGARSYKEVLKSPGKAGAAGNGSGNPLIFFLMDSIGFWNVRGMNRVSKQKAINFFLQNKGVGLFGLLETKIKSNAFHKVVNNFNNWSISTNSGYHNGGRIWILWQPRSFRVHFFEYYAQFIHMKVESLVSRIVFFLTMVYAFNGINDIAPLWGHLRRIAGTIVGPWAIAGDFNCVLTANERVGGNVPSSEMEPFRDCVADCGVLDIAATGALYTWNNKQQPEERIYSRLDRVLVNKDWCDHLRDLYAHFLPEGLYDHTPCIVSSNKQV
ncbi:uncharacterized protein LOC141632819 [Silene latifolia]|uniref:uncharacterized protein LOC141632819 n=1 Tax=Silene latifolia TaxID=37657 RepID=UPI003D76DEDD